MNYEFDPIWEKVKHICSQKYNINCGKNSKFLGENIYSKFKDYNKFIYAECGVYGGNTFMPIFHLCDILFDEFELYAIDSFSGFPDDVIGINDKFERFVELHNDRRITDEHFTAAIKRFNMLSNNEHLKSQYFTDYSDRFHSYCENKKGIKIIQTTFDDLITNLPLDKTFDIVFLDCDLYLSYIQCFEFFNNKCNIIILDEYYSLKYPGARIATDKFINKNKKWKLFNKIEDNPYFERWGLIKIEQ